VLRSIEDVVIRLTGKPYVDKFLNDDTSCVRLVRNHIYGSPNKQPVCKENINYN
jgi:hypothetical protein